MHGKIIVIVAVVGLRSNDCDYDYDFLTAVPTVPGGYQISIDYLTEEKELLALHGMGPKAVRILKQLLADEGLRFKH